MSGATAGDDGFDVDVGCELNSDPRSAIPPINPGFSASALAEECLERRLNLLRKDLMPLESVFVGVVGEVGDVGDVNSASTVCGSGATCVSSSGSSEWREVGLTAVVVGAVVVGAVVVGAVGVMGAGAEAPTAAPAPTAGTRAPPSRDLRFSPLVKRFSSAFFSFSASFFCAAATFSSFERALTALFSSSEPC